MVIRVFLGSVKRGRKRCADSNCPRQNDKQPFAADVKIRRKQGGS
jgi:hypothetical protein